MFRYDWSWIYFTRSEGQALSVLALGIFVVVVAVTAAAILLPQTKRRISWMVWAAFSLCVFLSYITSTLYYWHHYFRRG